MSERKRHVRAILKDLLDRYIAGNVNDSEQEFVEKLYDKVQRDASTETNIDPIGQDIKEGIHHRLQKKRSLINLYRPWYTAASIVLVCTLLIMARMIIRSNQRSAMEESAYSSNPMLLLQNNERIDLLDTLPKGLRYTRMQEEKVLSIASLSDIANNGKVRIENPSRKVFSILLEDSTQVWLNYQASIEIDPGFQLDKRSVQVNGEVFFAVHKKYMAGKKVPFFVKTRMQTIEVLGTKFNVDASADHEENVLLAEGSVRLTHNHYGTQVLMKPGQQAFLEKGKSKILVIHSSEIEKANSWRKGLFYFENEKLLDVVDEFKAWYGSDIDIDPAIANVPITGIISRYENIEDALRMIKMTNNINYSIKKGKIYVTKLNP